VKPETLVRWHRELFRIVWRRKSKRKGRSRKIAPETIALVKQMAEENRLWGAERIRGELLKLGIRVSKRTIQKHIRGIHKPHGGGPKWSTFLHNHADEIWACDFLQTHDVFFRPIFAFVIIELSSRSVLFTAVTRSPCDEWTAQQFRNLLYDHAPPRFLIRDNDSKFGGIVNNITSSAGIRVLRTPIQAPKANAVCERFMGSLRRECLDHIIILSQSQMMRNIGEYVRFFNEGRPHQGLGQVIPAEFGAQRPRAPGKEVTATPVLGGLHHDYRLAA